jgi:Na+/melibiose symporter-like transporter
MIGILIRFFMALALVFATWNPTGWSFVHWLLRTWPAVTAPLVFAGVVLLIGWVLFLQATLQSLGMLGILLAGAFFGSLTWLLFDLGWLSTQNGVMSYMALALIAAVLALGMSWSHVWRRLSGQVEVDEVSHH